MKVLNILLNTESLLTTQRTGIPHYTGNLLEGLLAKEEISTLYTFTGSRLVKYHPPNAIQKCSFWDSFFTSAQYSPILKYLIHHLTYKNFEAAAKKKIVANTLYFEPNFIVKPYHGKCVTTLHDLTCLRFPELQPSERVKWFEEGVEQTLRQANHIISVSNFTRNEAIKYLSISPDKISTIYNGVSSDFCIRNEFQTRGVLQKYNLKYKRYLLSVSTLEPRKNLLNLVKGYLQLPNALREQYPLVLIGAVGWKIQELLDQIKNRNDIKTLGYIPQDELSSIFSAAKGFGYLSTYEGFGLPVLEALASGIPVLTSEASAMAEFSQENALLAEPLNVGAIKNGFEQLLLDENLTSNAINRAKYYSDHFSWEKCVTQTFEILKKMASRE